MAWTTADIPDLTGRVAVVTGASGGLGLEATRELARKGAHVIMAARDRTKAERALAEILADVPSASLELQGSSTLRRSTRSARPRRGSSRSIPGSTYSSTTPA